jgi:hypothetical protein
MKQSTKKWIILVALGFFAFNSFAQPVKIPRWVSDKGYWVVESNLNNPLDHLIRFYNNDDVLIYTEKLSGIRLDVSRRKVKMKLKKALDASVLAWEQKRTPEEKKNLLAAILK